MKPFGWKNDTGQFSARVEFQTRRKCSKRRMYIKINVAELLLVTIGTKTTMSPKKCQFDQKKRFSNSEFQ